MIGRRPPGFKSESTSGRLFDGKIYLGLIKGNADVQRMGRLQVWLPELGGAPEDSANWYTVSYASPFAGATNYKDNGILGSQRSYGFWFVPPDLNNEVLIVFLNGEPSRGIWFACLYQQYMNHMTPGIPSNVGKGVEPHCGGLPPVMEYDKTDKAVVPPDPPRLPFAPLDAGLCTQGLYSDAVRGTSSSGARREAPSQVYGIKTPNGQHFVMDDNLESEFIRIRTKGGTQILVSETAGFVYINSKRGNSWVEISDAGIDMYSRGDISLRSEQNINLRADGDVNIDGGGNVNMRAEKATVKIASGTDTHIGAIGSIFLQPLQSLNAKVGLNLVVQTDGDIRLQSGGQLTLKSVNDQQRWSSAGLIFDQGSEPPTVVAPAALTKQPLDLPDTQSGGGDCCGSPFTRSTIVCRMPAHEPWSVHNPAAPTINPPKCGESLKPKAGAITHREKTLRTSADPNMTNSPRVRSRLTGSGRKSITSDPNADKTVNLANRKIRTDVINGIAQAASKTGVSPGFLLAMGDAESSLNPNASPGTSSATGVFQFTDSTWADMVKKYGEESGIGIDDKEDPYASAFMAAKYAQENQAYLETHLGRPVTEDELYLAHFLGPAGATKFLNAPADGIATNYVGAGQVAANKAVFYDSSGSARSVQDVQSRFQAKIGNQISGWNDAEPQLLSAANPTVVAAN